MPSSRGWRSSNSPPSATPPSSSRAPTPASPSPPAAVRYAERLRKLPVDRVRARIPRQKILKALGDDALHHRPTPPRPPTQLHPRPRRRRQTPRHHLHADRRAQTPASRGKVLRTNAERRLDGRTHLYRRWPAEIDTTPPPDLDRALATRFLSWSAPPTVDDFAWWSGIGKRAAKEAIGSLRIDDVARPTAPPRRRHHPPPIPRQPLRPPPRPRAVRRRR